MNAYHVPGPDLEARDTVSKADGVYALVKLAVQVVGQKNRKKTSHMVSASRMKVWK